MKTDGIIGLIAAVRRRANELIIKEMKNRGIKNLAVSHGSILTLLFRENRIRMSDIAARIDRDKSTVTTLVNKLINAGYVKQVSDPDDSRAKLIVLTEAGLKLKKDFDEISAELLDRTYSGFNDEEKQNLVTLLTRIKNNF